MTLYAFQILACCAARRNVLLFMVQCVYILNLQRCDKQLDSYTVSISSEWMARDGFLANDYYSSQ